MDKKIKELLSNSNNSKMAIYGLGTETERLLKETESPHIIIGLLDGFRTNGEIYGYPIISLDEAVAKEVSLILVVARPGSCKAIAKRIGSFCRENSIELYDVRGKNLLDENTVRYNLSDVNYLPKQDLIEKINRNDVISFDLFDTLVMRKIQAYYDIFEIMQVRLSESGIIIPDFSKIRLALEKELSKEESPSLEKIYERLIRLTGCNYITADKLADMEYEIDISFLVAREEMVKILGYAASLGKRVFLTTDTYYSREQIENILKELRIVGFSDLLVSSERNTYKIQNLFEYLLKANPDTTPEKILHIGDDERADIECSSKYGISSFRIPSAADLWEELGELGTSQMPLNLSDKVKIGLFTSKLFNNPFVFEKEKVRISDAKGLGYLLFAPIISDFSIWFEKGVKDSGINQTLLCARDGYLIQRLWNCLKNGPRAIYFLTSRTAAIRAGMIDDQDIAYVDSMKFGGSEKDCLKVRFGINEECENPDERKQVIINRAKLLKENYRKYINNQNVRDEESAVFDFVAKGTTQLYLSKLFNHHLKGFYFLQLEPEFMKNKNLDIVPFYSDSERETSEIYDNYYILETIVTSPFPSVDEFDEAGEPVYAKETRSERDIACIMKVQEGIIDYFKEYIKYVPESLRKENKKLDEVFLSLVNKFEITDEDFISLKVEDPFFGRMTDVKDLI